MDTQHLALITIPVSKTIWAFYRKTKSKIFFFFDAVSVCYQWKYYFAVLIGVLCIHQIIFGDTNHVIMQIYFRTQDGFSILVGYDHCCTRPLCPRCTIRLFFHERLLTGLQSNRPHPFIKAYSSFMSGYMNNSMFIEF